MNKQSNPGILETTVSRREFLAGMGGLTFSFALGGGLLGRASEVLAAEPAIRMSAWVTIWRRDAPIASLTAV